MNQPPDDPPPSSMNPEERAKMLLEQRLLEQRLEIARSVRLQRESGRGRPFMILFLFLGSAMVAFYLDHRGVRPQVSILAFLVTFVVIAAFWSYRR